MTLEASSPPRGSEAKPPLRAGTAGLPSGPCPCQRTPCVDHLSALVEQTGALGVPCFLIQWCQTLHLSSEAQHDPPRAPSVTMPRLHEPSLFLGSPGPQLTLALHRTSLAEGRVGGRVDGRHGGGEATLAQSSRLLGLRPGAKKESICVCMCVCARACTRVRVKERECVCVQARVSSPRLYPVYVCMFL